MGIIDPQFKIKHLAFTKGAALKLTSCEGLLRSGDGWAARPKPRACLRNRPAAVGFAQPSVGREGANPFPARLVIVSSVPPRLCGSNDPL